MKKINSSLKTWIILAVLLAMTTACSSLSSSGGEADQPATSILTQAQATEMAENALHAINAGDYVAYSRDWSEAMKDGIKEAAFQEFREQLISSSGEYVSISAIELIPAKTSGYVRWVFTVNFEKAKLKFNLTFAQDGDKVEGALFEPVS